MSERIIPAERSIVVAADVESVYFSRLVDEIKGVGGIGGVKIGFEVGLGIGLRHAVDIVRRQNDSMKIVYDHQKAGTDIPDTGRNFGRVMRASGVDAAILFPFTGPNVEESYIKELQEAEVGVIVGAEMTHPNIAGENGYVKKGAFKKMFAQAIGLGVRNFVVPGNKPDRVAYYKNYFDREIGEGNYDLFAPGFVAQGGEITSAGKAAGKRWHAIVGRGITQAANVRLAAEKHVQQIKDQEAA